MKTKEASKKPEETVLEQDPAKEAIERKPGGDPGVPGLSGGSPPARVRIPSNTGTQSPEKTNENSTQSVTKSIVFIGDLSQNWQYYVRLVYRQPGRNWRELKLREVRRWSLGSSDG